MKIRGPIEAPDAAHALAVRDVYPRMKIRGPIEAPRRPQTAQSLRVSADENPRPH